MDEFKFEITANLGVLSESPKGWLKEVNMVSWNERNPKLDIREWSPDHQKMGKGVTLNPEEARKLKEIMEKYIVEDLES